MATFIDSSAPPRSEEKNQSADESSSHSPALSAEKQLGPVKQSRQYHNDIYDYQHVVTSNLTSCLAADSGALACNDSNKNGNGESSTLALHEESTGRSFIETEADGGKIDEDLWFTGDRSSLERDDMPACTPPLALFSGTKFIQRNAVPGSVSSSVSSSVANTPTSQTTGILSGTQPGSAGSNTISSIPKQYRPILYSAIGSLENFNASSYKDIKRRGTVRSSFSKLGATQPPMLVAPSAATVELKDSKSDGSRTLMAIDSSTLILQQKESNAKVLNKASSLKATPTASNRKHAPSVKSENKDGKPSNLRKAQSKDGTNKGKAKKVSIKKDPVQKKPKEMFRPSCDAYTPRIEKKRFEFKRAEMRTPVQKMASPMGTLSRPNFRDALRRVAMIIHQHIVKIEGRFQGLETRNGDHGLFKKSMRAMFSEDNYCTPTYKCTMVRIPMARPGMIYGLRKMNTKIQIPSEEEIYEFAHQLFKAVQLSSECSIICLIYVERLMEAAKVPLLANTWRPIFMCGLLLASKVWQDLSSWNIEFASVYPQYSLEAINRLELNFLRNVKWDLYISTSLYAKYYFALRSLVEKVDFRQRYNRMVGGVDSVAQAEAVKIAKRTEQFKEETLLQLSRSM